jgi:signal transduction histidine kinase
VQSALATFMPFFWIGLAFILTMDAIGPVLVSSPNTTFTWSITGLGLMILLVLLRQAIAFSENANLSSRLARLLNTSRVLGEPSTTTSLPNLILPQIQQLLPADQICIVLLREQNHADIYRWTDPADKREPEHILVSAEIMPVFNTTLPIALTRPFAAWHMPIVTWLISAAAKPAVFNSVLIAPMKSNNRAVGLIVVGHGTPNCYSEEDAETLIAFAHQAGATVENVHLRRQEALAAAQAERSRLARELHDSVSQTLFGIALGARTAQELITTDTTRTQDALDYVVNLVDGAQAETKALIYELRPEILATEGLLTALHMQSESLCKRHGLLINFRAACDEPDISLRTKEALYRISMEAIQNTIRHASAGVVNISIERQTEHLLKLCIQDDGRGFDTQATYPGHFGLHTMRERAEGIGAHLSVASSPMQGTTLCVITPV